MHKLLCMFALAALVAAAPSFAQKSRDLGDVVISADLKTIPVTVSGSTAELNNLANQAFNAHGRYRRVPSGASFDVRFTQVGSNQVQVTVTKRSSSVSVETEVGGRRYAAAGAGSSGVVLNQVVQGTSLRNALLRAADMAVTATSGLKGFFASQLAFISEYTGKSEVFTGDLFFGEVRQVTKDGKQAITPRWTPDGSKVVYTSFYKSGFPDIFLIDLRSLQRTTFISAKGTNSGARFSPNGSRVAMILSGAGNPEIYLSDAQGKGVVRRTRTPTVEAGPAWSPDGSRLVFTSDAAGGPQLYIMPVSGGAAQRVPTNISRYCAEPDWSAGDPNKIAFTTRIGKGFQIAVMDLSKRAPAQVVSKAPVDAVEPSWLADGRHLVYTERAPNTRSIWLLDTESGKRTRLSSEQLRQTSQASVWLR